MISGASRFIAAWAVLIALVAPAFSAQPLKAEDVMAQMRQVKEAKGYFTERKMLAMLSMPIETKGTLTYKAPDLLIKHTLQPQQEKLTVRGDLVTIVQGHEKLRALSLSTSPQITALVESIRATLSGDLETLNRYYEVAVDGTTESWQLTLTPKDTVLAEMVTSIRIEGVKDTIRSVDTLESNGDRTVMTMFGKDS